MVHSIEQIREIIKNKIPSGLVVPEHTDTGHFYRHVPSNLLFSSVTAKCGILDSPHLKKWSAKLAVEYICKQVEIDPSLLQPGKIVTLKPAAILAHQDHFEDAGDVGTKGHKVIEDYLLDWMNTGNRPESIIPFVPNDSNDSRVIAIARSAEKFCKDFLVIPIVSEMKIASVKYKYGGTLDSLMMVFNKHTDGEKNCEKHDFLQLSKRNPNKVKCLLCGLSGEYEFSIVDWKTSNSIDKVEYAMQTAAYWQALYEMTGLKPKRIYVVRIDKAVCKYEVRVLTNRKQAFKSFFHAANLYDWLNDGNDKLINATPRETISLESITLKNGTNN